VRHDERRRDAQLRFAAERVELIQIRTSVEPRMATRAIINAAIARSGSGLSAACVNACTSCGRITKPV